MNKGNWKRVSRSSPCPVCERPDWCLLAADESAAICSRVESKKRCGEAGWLHRLTSAPWSGQCVRRLPLVASAGRNDLGRLAVEYQEAADQVPVLQLADSLGLSLTSLCQFRVGWSVEHRAWSFPMVDTEQNVVGIRLRRPDGFKFAVKGGKEGLFVPANVFSESSPLLVCEGPTDAAALLDLGFPNAVGRPSCTGGIKLLVRLVQRSPAKVVLIADNDEPGRRGADNLASVLAVYAPAVQVVTPPEGIKDVRDWLRAGAKQVDVERVIETAPALRLSVRGKAVLP
jgi:hypothetical protein